MCKNSVYSFFFATEKIIMKIFMSGGPKSKKQKTRTHTHTRKQKAVEVKWNLCVFLRREREREKKTVKNIEWWRENYKVCTEWWSDHTIFNVAIVVVVVVVDISVCVSDRFKEYFFCVRVCVCCGHRCQPTNYIIPLNELN